MGIKGGRKPTPRPILSIRGSRHAKSRIGEPVPIGSPKKPEWLGEVASAKWDELLPMLERMGVTAETYGDFLAQFCEAFQDFCDAKKEIEEYGGATCLSDKGNRYQHPAVALKLGAINRMLRFGCEFGLSPSSIRSVTKTDSKNQAPLISSARKRG